MYVISSSVSAIPISTKSTQNLRMLFDPFVLVVNTQVYSAQFFCKALNDELWGRGIAARTKTDR